MFEAYEIKELRKAMRTYRVHTHTNVTKWGDSDNCLCTCSACSTAATGGIDKIQHKPDCEYVRLKALEDRIAEAMSLVDWE